MKDLEGKTVAVVGAGSGIGLATARAAAAAGARTVLFGRTREPLVAAGVGEPVVLDMLDRKSIDAAMARVGDLDHLVLAAAGDELAQIAPIEKITDEQIERSLDKLRGYLFVSRAAAPRLRGSLTIVSGVSARKPPKGFAALAPTNAGVESLGQVLAVELAPRRVNTVMPGLVDTPRHRDRAAVKAAAEALPAHRFGQPEDIAAAILFLVTNPYMTGQTVVIDGGLTLT